MLNKLAPRERQIVDILYESGSLTAAEVCDRVPDQLSGSAIRAMLKRLEDKGFVVREDIGDVYRYSPVIPQSTARKSALSEIVRVFFNGSASGAATALLGMSERLSREELEELELMIAKALADKGEK